MENNCMGNIIKEKRKALGITQKDLANALGVSDKAVSKWERSESLPDVSLIPQIAATLGVSINYLFGSGNCGTANCPDSESTLCSDTEKQKTLAASAAMLQHKINMRYTVTCLVIIAIMLYFFFSTTSIIYYPYRPLFFSFLAAATYAVAYMGTQKHRLLQKEIDANCPSGHLDKVLCITALSCVFYILVFGYISLYPFSSKLDSLSMIFAQWIGAESFNYSLYHLSPTSTAVYTIIFTAVMLINIFVAEKKFTFQKNVYITTTAFAVLVVLHTVFYSFTGAVIIKNKTFMYTFWLDNPNVIAVLRKLSICNIVYAFIALAFAAVFMLLLKDKHDKAVYAVCTVALWIYQSVSAFGFINKDFDGMGSNYAQLKTGSIFLSIALVAIVPHIVMVINGTVKSKEK